MHEAARGGVSGAPSTRRSEVAQHIKQASSVRHGCDALTAICHHFGSRRSPYGTANDRVSRIDAWCSARENGWAYRNGNLWAQLIDRCAHPPDLWCGLWLIRNRLQNRITAIVRVGRRGRRRIRNRRRRQYIDWSCSHADDSNRRRWCGRRSRLWCASAGCRSRCGCRCTRAC